MRGGWLPVPGYRVDAPQALGVEQSELESALTECGIHRGKGVTIRLELGSTRFKGREAYDLTVDEKGVLIKGASPHGVFNGIQSLRQIADSKGIKQVEVHDAPRFQWRGYMLDVSRHFYPVADIKHFVDLASRYKLNTFHWHLSDDGGWRLEIKKYPELTRRGAFRIPANGSYNEYKGMDFPPVADRPPTYGGFYTQDEVRDVVDYAWSKHIEIIPELDMPGHNLAACISYPSLVCSPSLKEAWKRESIFEFPNIYCAGKESTYVFVQGVLDEVLELFPSKVIHIGGDEVDKFLWSRCSDCQAKMKQIGTARPEKLESYFVERVERYLNRKGRTLIGWDEITEGGLSPNAMVMSWRGADGGIAAAKLRHQVVMTPYDWVYLNAPQEHLPLEKVYAFNPVPEVIPSEMREFVIGAEGCLWTETIPDRGTAERHLYPRLLALSQVLWTPQPESFEKFTDRFQSHLPKLAAVAPNMYFAPPVAEYSVVADSQPVSLAFTAVPGTEVRYQISKSSKIVLPTASSPIYSDKVTVGVGQTLVAARMRLGELLSVPTLVQVVDLKPRILVKPRRGLWQDTFLGKFSQVPSFSSLQISTKAFVNRIAEFDPQREWYAQRLTGYFVAPQDGRYTFSLGSDDGSTFSIAGARLVDNDGLHGYVEHEGSVKLQKGAYPIEIGYFQASEAAKLTLRYRLNNGPLMECDPLLAVEER